MLSISSDVHEYEECLTKFLTSVQWNKNAENCVSELLTLNDGKNTKKESTSYEEGNPYSDEPLLPPPYASNSIVSPKADSRITIDAALQRKILEPFWKSDSEDLRPTPVSLAHEWLLFTRDERVALYEYALQHTQPPPTPPELVLQPGSVTEGDGKEEAVLRKHQRDLRRRRQAYRTAATGSKTLTEVTREVIRNIMELIGVPVDTPHKTDLCQTKSSYYNADPSNISVSSSSDPKNISTYKNLQTSEHRRHHKHISRRLKHRSTSHADDSACYRKRGDSSVLKRDKRKTEKRNKSYERAKK